MIVGDISRRFILQAGLALLGSEKIMNTVSNLLQPNTYTVPIAWNDALLQTIRTVKPGVPAGARALAVLHTCMFDAWAAYDEKAVGTYYGNILRRPNNEHTLANKEEAISYAAYRALTSLFPSQTDYYTETLKQLGYTRNTATNALTPSGIGNMAAQGVLSMRFRDGANQLGDLHAGPYTDYTEYKTPNTPDQVNDPSLWQPLRIPQANGQFVVQKCTTPHWGYVKPFALTSGSQLRPKEGPAKYGSELYLKQANYILDLSAGLTDTQKVIAEFWEDGPGTEQPPGHWCLITQYVMRRDAYNIDNAVKLFFMVANALFDASIACWDTKCHFNSARPITAIRYLYRGKQIQAWAGPLQGTKLIAGETWHPYQRTDFVTPPFPEFTSGHSTFSGAASAILGRYSGSDYFGATHVQKVGISRLEPGFTPKTDITLSWQTFTEAAQQAGMSRLYGGIHFMQANLVGQNMGRAVANLVWDKTQRYIQGTVQQSTKM